MLRAKKWSRAGKGNMKGTASVTSEKPGKYIVLQAKWTMYFKVNAVKSSKKMRTKNLLWSQHCVWCLWPWHDYFQRNIEAKTCRECIKFGDIKFALIFQGFFWFLFVYFVLIILVFFFFCKIEQKNGEAISGEIRIKKELFLRWEK